MKDINQLIAQRSANGSPKPSWTSKTSTGDSAGKQDLINAETKTLVNMIFARFMTIYGHKFKSTFENENEIRIAKREWALSLRDYSEQELVHAVNRCKEEFVWMPTVSEFLSVLKKGFEDYGLPTSRQAYEEVCMHADHPRKHTWSHPAVYFAGRETDWFRLRSEEKSQVFTDFKFNYRKLCQRVLAGEDLQVPMAKGLPDKSSNTQADLIKTWGEENQVTPEQAATLLFYLQKPKDSSVRAHFKARSEQLLKEWGVKAQLP
ncbi:MAG: replication protein P [Motiliproteus sp.]|nr:replication protein P [Motiliproteus sp.]